MSDRKLLNIELGRITPAAYKDLPPSGLVVVLDNIRSAHNVGSAFRTADAFGIDKVLLCGISAVPPSAEIRKSALGAEDAVIGFDVVPAAAAEDSAVVVTCAAGSGALEGLSSESIKVTDLAEFPAKGRATGGVRAHRFLRGEDHLTLGSAAMSPALAAAKSGAARTLPVEMGRRDGSGIPLDQAIDTVASSPEALAKHFDTA